MATSGLYGSTASSAVALPSGSESSGLYGNNTVFGGTYFEWLIFKESATAPSTPTGGTWDFTTNVGTPPTGWLNAPPATPTYTVWMCIAVVNSRNTFLSWSSVGKFADGNMESKFGSFYDTTTQTLASTTAAQAITINNTSESRGVSIVNNTKITFASQRTYSFTFSLQFQNSNTQIETATVWLKYNGVDYPNSASVVDIPSSHGGIPGSLITTINFVATSQSGGNDYVEIYWCGTSTNISIKTINGGTSPVTPVSPSIILTVTQV